MAGRVLRDGKSGSAKEAPVRLDGRRRQEDDDMAVQPLSLQRQKRFVAVKQSSRKKIREGR